VVIIRARRALKEGRLTARDIVTRYRIAFIAIATIDRSARAHTGRAYVALGTGCAVIAGRGVVHKLAHTRL